MLALIITCFALTLIAQPERPMRIEEVRTRDITGVLKTTFRRGEMVVIDVRVYGQAVYYYYYEAGVEIQYMCIVEVFYGTTVMYLGFVRDTIAQGEAKSVGIGFTIPSDAPTGTYRVKVFVWNKWPSEAGFQILAEPMEITFEVTG